MTSRLSLFLWDGLKWHDDEPLTVEDVKFTLELMLRTPGYQCSGIRSHGKKAIQGAQDSWTARPITWKSVVIDGSKITVNF